MRRKAYMTTGAAAVGPYSHGVECGNMVYLSGQTPLDPGTGKLVEGNVGEQTKQCFANLFAVIEACSLTPDHVGKVNVYLTDMNDFEEMNLEYEKHFTQPFPARTTVAVAALPLGARIEIEMVLQK